MTAASAPRRRPRAGFTLLEVLLAMFLVSFVLVALMMAIDTQFRVVEATRSRVEEAQLARVLLHRIADDLRCLVPKADSVTVASASTESSSGSSTESSRDSSGAANSETSSNNQTTRETYEPTEASVSASQPGLIGGADWIQFDICRLPRPDQWERLLEASDAGMAAGQLFGLKTMAYYLAAGDQALGETTTLGSQQSGGLVRLEAAWGSQSDSSFVEFADAPTISAADQQNVEPLAPEVTELGFRYFDGADWLESWDSSESGKLPVAVEITLVLRPFGATSQTERFTELSEGEEDASLLYRLVVDLPAAQIRSTASDAGSSDSATTEGTRDETGNSEESTP
jgi:prepilin-type N-terminal cleavage/methylation domain-containing protein